MLKLNKQSNPLDQISDLVQILDGCLQQDYMIAGGFVRDWYQDEPFNDVDIYLFREDNLEKLSKNLKATKRFSFIRKADLFLDTVFHEKGSFLSKGRPKYNVQFISWYKSPKDVVDSFDFDHCKFFIPMENKGVEFSTSTNFIGFIPRIPYAYDCAVETLKKKELRFSRRATETLGNLSTRSGDSAFAVLEKHIKRTKKFVERGFYLSEEIKFTLVNSTEKLLSNVEPKKSKSRAKSILLEDVDYVYVFDYPSDFSEEEIVRNLTRELILLHTASERAIFLTSPSSLIREVAKDLIEKAVS